MPEYERQHYVQKSILKNFASKSDNDKYKINIIDINNNKIEVRNVERAFYEKNLYDVKGNDEKKLEKDLGAKIEIPFCEILEKIMQEKDKLTITRKELMIIKKYLLVQIYRNYKNSFGYSDQIQDKKEMSSYNIKVGESKLDFWKREIQTILDTEWDDIINNCDLVGVKKQAIILHTGFLMFFKTDSEFLINDIGFTIERVPIMVDIPADDYIKIAEQIGKSMFNVDDFGESAKRELETNSSYIDNFIWFSFAPGFAIVAVDKLWREMFLNPKTLTKLDIPPSPILSKHFSLPVNNFINQKLIRNAKTLAKYKSQNDTYVYTIHKLNENETIYINHLYLNEAFQYVGFKSVSGILPSIVSYNALKNMGYGNMKNSFEEIEHLLKKCSDN